MNYMSLGKKLKYMRECAGYSQNEVAKKLNISRQAISKWENEWTSPDIDNLLLLSKLYGVTVDELLNDSSNENTESTSKGYSQNKNSGKNQDNSYLMILEVATCMLPSIGLFLLIAISIYYIKSKQRLSSINKLVLVICFIINIANTFIWINNIWLHLGKATVESVAFLDQIP